MYVVTGATGHLGRLVVDELLARGVPADQVVATGRAADRLAPLAERGVRTAVIDYERPETMTAAFAGAHTLVLVSGSEFGRRAVQHANAIEAAKAAGVERVLYTSAPHADTSELAVVPEHLATEQTLAASGLRHTIARNNWYTENYEQTFAQAAATGVVLSSTGDGRVASAPRADYAAALAVLALDGEAPRVVELSGDTAWSMDEFAAAAGAVLGREVVHQQVGPDEHAAILTGAGLDPQLVGFVVAVDAGIARGDLADATSTLSTLLGRPSTPLEVTLREWAARA